MNNEQKHSGFSLTEVLIAVGILSVGMIFVAGVFPAGIYLMTIATERTIAAVAADEAFAKIKIYATGDLDNSPINDDYDPNEWPLEVKNAEALADFNDANVFPATADINSNEFAYPSDPGIDVSEKQYCWSALCRLTELYNAALNPNPPVQVTVFINRKTGLGLRYPKDDLDVPYYDWPMPVKVSVVQGGSANELRITGDKRFINDGCTIVDDATGRIYRVLERYVPPADDTILLDGRWEGGASGFVWVVPPPVGGGRYPCIAVYQKVIRF